MFQLVATLMIGFVFVIWSKDDYRNLMFKAAFGAVTLWGVFATAVAFGYLVKL